MFENSILWSINCLTKSGSLLSQVWSYTNPRYCSAFYMTHDPLRTHKHILSTYFRPAYFPRFCPRYDQRTQILSIEDESHQHNITSVTTIKRSKTSTYSIQQFVPIGTKINLFLHFLIHLLGLKICAYTH